PVRVGVLVPLSDGRQDVLGRRAAAPGFHFRESEVSPNLRAEWTADRATATALTYDLALRIAEPTATPIPAEPVAALPRPPDGEAALAPTPHIQSDAPEVRRRAQRLVGRATRLDEVIWSLYQYTAAFVPAADPPGPQDAVTVLAARRGTSLGRARTRTALLQAAGVPARRARGRSPAGRDAQHLRERAGRLGRPDRGSERAGGGDRPDPRRSARRGHQLCAADRPLRVALLPGELPRAAGRDQPAPHPA